MPIRKKQQQWLYNEHERSVTDTDDNERSGSYQQLLCVYVYTEWSLHKYHKKKEFKYIHSFHICFIFFFCFTTNDK